MRRLALLFFLMTAALAATACAPSPGEVSVEPTAPAAPALPVDSTPQATVEAPAGPTDPSSAQVVFRIIPEQSEARFLIDEILAGSPKTVVGVTSDVSGEIAGDFASPQSVVVGPIQVDMSSLRTDNSFRNRAIHDAILQTGNEANRYATFLMTSIEGLPAEVAFGTPYNLSLAGDLTIRGVTRPVIFEAVVTPVSETRLEGTASVSLPYRDFDVQILRLPPQVASVGDVVTLEIDFVAEPS